MMLDFKPAEINNSDKQKQEILKDIMEKFPMQIEDAKKILEEHMNREKDCLLFINDKYQVLVRKIKSPMVLCDVIWLSIKRLDKNPIHDWGDLQTIKNKLVGAENEAIEIYPAESRLVDTSNRYHLWVFADSTYRIPLGYNERLVFDSEMTPVRSKIKRNRGKFKK